MAEGCATGGLVISIYLSTIRTRRSLLLRRRSIPNSQHAREYRENPAIHHPQSAALQFDPGARQSVGRLHTIHHHAVVGIAESEMGSGRRARPIDVSWM